VETTVGHRTKGDVVDEDRVKGKAKQGEGEIQETWGEAKDKARDMWDDAKDALDGDDEDERSEREEEIA
jgi:uncharacterized protein YjbJ (UPF0337 family)